MEMEMDTQVTNMTKQPLVIESSAYFDCDELEAQGLSVLGSMTVAKGRKLTIMGDVEIQGNLVLQHGASLIIQGNTNVTKEVTTEEKSQLDIKGNLVADALMACHRSLVTTMSMTINDSIVLASKARVEVNGSIYFPETNKVTDRLVMQYASYLTVTKDMTCSTTIKLARSCRLAIHGALTVCRVFSESDSSLCLGSLNASTVKLAGKCELSVTGDINLSNSLFTARKSKVTVKGSLNVVNTLNIGPVSTLIIEGETNIEQLLDINEYCDIRMEGKRAAVNLLAISSSIMSVKCDLNIQGKLEIDDSCVKVEGQLVSLDGISLVNDCKLEVMSNLKTPLLTMMTNNLVEIHGCLIVGDKNTNATDDMTHLVEAIKKICDERRPRKEREADLTGFMIGCNSKVNVKSDAIITRLLQIDYMSCLNVTGDLVTKAKVVIRVIDYKDEKTRLIQGKEETKVVSSQSKKGLPIVRVKGDMKLQLPPNKQYVVRVLADIQVSGKLEYDTTNEELTRTLKNLVESGTIKTNTD